MLKSLTDFSLYLVTNREGLTLDQFFSIICQSIEGGVKVVQLREKETSTREICEIARALQPLLKRRSIPLLINDRVDIAHAVNADGVHLGQSDLKLSEARALLGKRAVIGLSVETMEHVREVAKEDIDYLAVSPLFPSQTKRDCNNPWGLDGLKQACATSPHPVIAIGGIRESNLEDVLDCGATGVAVISAIFKAPCPKTAALSFSNKMRRYADSRLSSCERWNIQNLTTLHDGK